MPTDRTENWAIKGGRGGHNLGLTVRLVLCEHKIVNDSGPPGIFGSILSGQEISLTIVSGGWAGNSSIGKEEFSLQCILFQKERILSFGKKKVYEISTKGPYMLNVHFPLECGSFWCLEVHIII